jgi:hypothetical protein
VRTVFRTLTDEGDFREEMAFAPSLEKVNGQKVVKRKMNFPIMTSRILYRSLGLICCSGSQIF